MSVGSAIKNGNVKVKGVDIMTVTGENRNNKKYKIIFSGELAQGIDHLTVKSRLANGFGVSGDIVGKLFTGEPVLVKGGLSYEEAQQFKSSLEKSGGIFHIMEATAIPPAPPKKETPPIPPITTPEKHNEPEPVAVPSEASRGEFTFRKVQNKSNTPKYVGAFILIIIIGAIIASNMQNSPYVGTTYTRKSPVKSQQRNLSLSEQPETLFQDPKKYYSIEIPGGYTLSDKSKGNKSKLTFSYSGHNTLTILASPMNKTWRPEQEMKKRVDAIRNKRAGPLSNYSIDGFQLVAFNGMDGYELVLSRGKQKAHSYSLVSSNNIAFAVAIVTTGDDAEENHDALDFAVQQTLQPK
jgi:hypothetical protein